MEWFILYSCPECGRVINTDDPLDMCPYDYATLVRMPYEQKRDFIAAYHRGEIDESTLEHNIVIQEVIQENDLDQWADMTWAGSLLDQ